MVVSYVQFIWNMVGFLLLGMTLYTGVVIAVWLIFDFVIRGD